LPTLTKKLLKSQKLESGEKFTRQTVLQDPSTTIEQRRC